MYKIYDKIKRMGRERLLYATIGLAGLASMVGGIMKAKSIECNMPSAVRQVYHTKKELQGELARISRSASGEYSPIDLEDVERYNVLAEKYRGFISDAEVSSQLRSYEASQVPARVCAVAGIIPSLFLSGAVVRKKH